ncbi:MAG TPA: YfhO family protein [Verrucomicrobiae bacterium]
MELVSSSRPRVTLWRLTNTRYIYADARFAEVLNQAVEPPGSFRTVMRSEMVAKPGLEHVQDFGDITVQTNAQGPMALLEFTDALPRVGLYSNWRIEDDPTALKTLSSRAFDPHKTVVLSQTTPITQTPENPDANPGTAKITKYEPKDLMVETNAKASTILLLNDKFDPNWSVSVDHKPAELLRCNYIMRGVFVPPGAHTVEFHFQPPLKFLYISIAAFVLGIILTARVIYARFWGDPDPPSRNNHKWRGPTPAPAW